MYLNVSPSPSDFFSMAAGSEPSLSNFYSCSQKSPLQNTAMELHQSTVTGKRKSMDKEVKRESTGIKTIDPLSLMAPDEGNKFKRQRLESSGDLSVPLTGNDEAFTSSSYVFLHSTVSRPASVNNQGHTTSSVSSGTYTSYPTPPQEEERILREEFYSQMNPSFSLAGAPSGSFGSLSGYGLPPYGAPPVPSPYMLPSFVSPPPSAYYNAYYNPPVEQLYSRPDYPPPPSRTPASNPPATPSSSVDSCPSTPASGPSCEEEEFVAETKLSKNIKKLTASLTQIPGLEKVRWQVSFWIKSPQPPKKKIPLLTSLLFLVVYPSRDKES